MSFATTQRTVPTGAGPKVRRKEIEKVVVRRLEPLEIARYWNLLYALVNDNLPADIASKDAVEKVLHSFTTGRSQVWLVFCIIGGEAQICGASWTRVTVDPDYGIRNFVIEFFAGYLPLNISAYEEVGLEFDKFARQNKCTRMVCYTNNARVIQVAKHFGAEARYTMMVKEITND